MIYATSDLHGYPLDNFLRLLESAGFSGEDKLYVIGDVIDRNGDGGIAMLRWMMDQPNVKMILGNHEAMLLSCAFLFEEITDINIEKLNDRQMHFLMQWMQNGARDTIGSLAALRKENPDALKDLLDYLRNLPLYAEVTAGGKDFLLVHSGLGNFSPEKKLSEYTPDDLLWYRPTAEERFFENVMTVFGHTPTGYFYGEKGRMYRTDTWINIDAGAAAGRPPMLLRLDDLQEFYVTEENAEHI